MREFNIFGPVNPQRHYHVDRVAVKAALREKVEKGRYITLNAGRQTGKTTLFREIIADLEMTGNYLGLLLNFERLATYTSKVFYEELEILLNEWRAHDKLTLPDPHPMRRNADFGRWLEKIATQTAQQCVLIIDEFDALSIDIAVPILSELRTMYLQRDELDTKILRSVILVGVRTIPSLLGGTQSPFNIADQFTVPYFTPAEVTDLLSQHTAETGQPFDEKTLVGIIHETEGQPFLVNRLGQLLTEDLVPDRTQAITPTDLDYALARLVNENNTHFASIRSKATMHKDAVITALFSPARYYDFLDETTQDLLMYGVFRVLHDEQGIDYARIANPIYRKLLVKAFAPSHDLIHRATTGSVQHRYLIDGLLHFDRLLDHFKAFMEEHGVRLLQSEKSLRPLEISGQYLLLSYLTAALQTIGGHVTIESLSTAGEMDLLAFYMGKRFLIETKVWYGMARYEQGKAQLVEYLQAAGLEKGYLVIFDEQLDANTLAAEEGDVFELVLDGKTLRVYLIGIVV